MLSVLKNLFKSDNGSTFFNPKPVEVPMTATITSLDNGKFGLVTRAGKFVGEYSRARDARRGAARRGFVVAEQIVGA